MPFVAAGVQVLSSSGRKWLVLFAIAAPVLFVTGIGRDAWQYSREADWKLSAYHSVAETIKAQTSPDDVCFLSGRDMSSSQAGDTFLP